jgi:hypothetical protein
MPEIRIISVEGEEGFEGDADKGIGVCIGDIDNLTMQNAGVAAKLWSKAIRKCPHNKFSLDWLGDVQINDESLAYVKQFARLTGLDKPELAREWLSRQGIEFLEAFGIEIYDKSDCLHCVLWSAINRYRDDPGGHDKDILLALADVVGDELASKAAYLPAPHQEQYVREINERIRKRIQLFRQDFDDLDAIPFWVGFEPSAQ